MSKIGSLYKWLPMAAVICLSACNDDDKNNNQSDAVECLELTASPLRSPTHGVPSCQS